MPLNFIAKAAIQVGLMAAQMALSMSRTIEGPRLDDLKVTMGDYGSPIPMIWGTRRVQGQIIWATDLKEVKVQSKTKGGKFNNYRYFGRWAVAVAAHEIAGITRIWFDTHLVLDLTGAGPISPFDFTSDSGGGKGGGGGAGAFSINDHISIYYGTETQEPDAFMAALVEDEHGAGSCPAYRGVAYIVFKDVPLEKVGNRIPQVTVEAVSTSTGFIPTETFTPSNTPQTHGWTFSPDASRLAWVSGNAYSVWDVAARSEMIAGTLPFYAWPDARFGTFNDGTMLAGDIYGYSTYAITPGGAVIEYSTYGSFGTAVMADGNGVEHWGTYSSGGGGYVFDGGFFSSTWTVSQYFADPQGSVWLVGYETGSATFHRLVNIGSDYPEEFTIAVGGSGPVYAMAVDDHFLIYRGGILSIVDPLTSTVTTGATVTSVISPVDAAFANVRPGAASIWIGYKEYSTASGAFLRTAAVPTVADYVYDQINHALITSTGGLRWYYLDRIAGQAVTLGEIATDVADQVGADDYDFAALDQPIDGYSATQGQANQILEPLFDAHDSDLTQHGFTMTGKKRGGTAATVLDTAHFVKADPRYTVRNRQGSELPRALTYNFADLDADQQPNNVRSARPLDTSGARGDRSIDLTTYVATPDTMRGLADRHFRRIWNERREAELSLTMQHLVLEPGDLRVLELDGEQWGARLIRMTVKADGTIGTEWRYDHPSLALTSGAGGAAFDGRPPSVIVVPLISKGFVLDIPLLSDADNAINPLLYTAAAPYAAGSWPGATIYEQIGTEYTDEFDAVASSEQATWGYATTALGDALATVWDRGHVVNVKLQVGMLTGCTEADIDTNPNRNLALLGNELVNFTAATLQGDGSYDLSGFKRGRRGTEQHTASHAVRDVFLMLDTADPTETGLSDVSTDLSFKAATAGRSVSGAFPIDLTFTGASLKPYSPVHLQAELSGSDWIFTWTRRTRVGGAWTGGSTIPLSEASEAYKVRIYDGVTLKRTLTVTSAAATYTSADQTTDFGAPLTSAPDWTVAQQSDAVGDGFIAEYV